MILLSIFMITSKILMHSLANVSLMLLLQLKRPLICKATALLKKWMMLSMTTVLLVMTTYPSQLMSSKNLNCHLSVLNIYFTLLPSSCLLKLILIINTVFLLLTVLTLIKFVILKVKILSTFIKANHTVKYTLMQCMIF